MRIRLLFLLFCSIWIVINTVTHIQQFILNQVYIYIYIYSCTHYPSPQTHSMCKQGVCLNWIHFGFHVYTYIYHKTETWCDVFLIYIHMLDVFVCECGHIHFSHITFSLQLAYQTPSRVWYTSHVCNKKMGVFFWRVSHWDNNASPFRVNEAHYIAQAFVHQQSPPPTIMPSRTLCGFPALIRGPHPVFRSPLTNMSRIALSGGMSFILLSNEMRVSFVIFCFFFILLFG